MFPRFKVKYLNIITTIVQRAEMKICITSMFRKRSEDGFQYIIYYISDRILKKIRNNNIINV